MATRLQQLFSLAVISVALYTPTAIAEYHSEEINEAQGLAKVSPERPPVSPEVMAAVVAKVKANPKLTAALIQANPRFKTILGIADNDPIIMGGTHDRKDASPTPKEGPIPTRANLPPSEQRLRLEETLTQVRTMLNTDPREIAQARAQQLYEADTTATSRSVAPTNRRLLSSIDPQAERLSARADSLQEKKSRMLQRERRFSKYTNSSGGASLQASMEFNRNVRGAVSPGANEQYQLALRDISETDRDTDVARRHINEDSTDLRPRRGINQQKEFAARPVGGVLEKAPLTRHKFSEFRITEDGAHSDSKQKPSTEGRHRPTYERSDIKP